VVQSLQTTGRLVIDVISMADRGHFDAVPSETYEIHSQARRQALGQVHDVLNDYAQTMAHAEL
jgi:hypothetical protein